MAYDMLSIADDGRSDWADRDGVLVVDNEAVQRSRLRVDTRKWLLSKLAPKKYGDKLSLAGADGEGPIELVATWREPST